MGSLVFGFLINTISWLISLFLSPILNIIRLYLPSSSFNVVWALVNAGFTGLSYFYGFFAWVLSYFAIPAPLISIVFMYGVYKFTIIIIVKIIRIIATWWNTLKP